MAKKHWEMRGSQKKQAAQVTKTLAEVGKEYAKGASQKVLMKDKIIVWLDSNLTQYCACYYLQKEIDADFYAIIDVTNKTRTFFENQK